MRRLGFRDAFVSVEHFTVYFAIGMLSCSEWDIFLVWLGLCGWADGQGPKGSALQSD